MRHRIPVLTQLRGLWRRPGRFLHFLPSALRKHNQSQTETWLPCVSENRNAAYWHVSSFWRPPTPPPCAPPCPRRCAPRPDARLGTCHCLTPMPDLKRYLQVLLQQLSSSPVHLYPHPLSSATVLPCDTGRAGDPPVTNLPFDSSAIPRKDWEVPAVA